ncbi:uncharacterized protein FFB20_02136 [Fusarium fujikuroi]|uniref:Uncharacterized protein n=1 Tax=Gibberella fujikuroi (strain CBS 195.34 / IMI 58289 / NRRL A-6831) TaxID=1279085 RepID=S0EPB7_GIBF5|nr:uncharacterized protein FFUJ_10909 [Fusarium fujikuroi IMI 58289]KLP03359.1 uncharacterized protein Y057_4641 [Fusarium fujikuroi]KLP18253.1 uncharacterized protein LW94_2695 [Fusarium fujikuroi]QGI70247.1 hypothetical protein CEK27_002576 [Fusarium fujikuroi]QGI87605.1 hypothetical protein CEK25_002561 [Fusarium fujikuroi]QGJ01136.1 hypothetical protein CEK26_002580 [Fusarium fujikuroi]
MEQVSLPSKHPDDIVTKSFSAETLSCPSSVSFRTTFKFSGDPDTYAHCDWFTSDEYYRVGTSCIGSTAYFTQWIEDGVSTSSTLVCNGDCVAIRLYDNPDDLEGLRWLVSCDDSIGVSTSISTLFLDDPIDWDTATETATETTTTTSESSTSESVGESSTDIEISSFTTFPSSTSEPEEPESPTGGETKGSDGPSGGVIAGAVVGSIAGVSLIVGVVILAFRMGRRSRGDGERPGGGIRDSLRSVPMPTRAFQEPEPKPPVPVIQPVFVQDSQPYHNNSES